MTSEEVPTGDDNGWFVSSFTNGGGSCVQVKFAASNTILVRDSKDRCSAPPIIAMPSHSWASLLKNINHSV
ncbi:DUF397 domain-containing protein [Actinophytocola sp.]|uniref:DUF397 domain-containing protein n=1 Tax=Actinophytocola sp. TaxID=1872138 RepID=UPI00389A359D